MHFSKLSPQLIADLRVRVNAMALSAVARQRFEWIARFVETGYRMSETCRECGISRNTLQRWIDRFDPEDLSSLEERSHEQHAVRQQTVPSNVLEKIRAYRQSQPLVGKERIVELLQQELGVTVSPSTVGRVIERECLYFADTPLHWRKRLQAQSAMPAPAVAPAIQPIAPVPADSLTHDHHHCLFCWVKSWNWPRLRRSAAIASVVCNLAFIAMVLTSAFVEKQQASVIDQSEILKSSAHSSSSSFRP